MLVICSPRPERLGPTVLVLSPTRELALQIEKEVQKFCYMGIRRYCFNIEYLLIKF